MTNAHIQAAAESLWDECSDIANKAMRLAMAYRALNIENPDIASSFLEDWIPCINSELSDCAMLENFVIDDFFPNILRHETFEIRLRDIEAQCIQEFIERAEEGNA